MDNSGSLIVSHPELAYGLLFLLQLAVAIIIRMSIATFKSEIAILKASDEKLEERIMRKLDEAQERFVYADARMRDFERSANGRELQIATLQAHYGDISSRLNRLEIKIDRLITGMNEDHEIRDHK